MSPERPLGSVKVANEVIAHIASLTASQVQGIVGMYPARARDGHRVLPAGSSYKGVRVDLGNEALNLELFVIVDHSAHVPTVAAEVQRQVADAIDKMLGLEVRQVNVFVGDVRFPEDA
ncbi:MAG: Asp23/Gls24 family envelope stress response protein [Chloroflexi bacterium]|nr:MAG: Asp23/Gls24 family envelope stress response protein [Chloroflexota bacterium]TME57892.1 MAG: Asp23/Gls24 family envelope stress response protein [Chloroflexota bacterium]